MDRGWGVSDAERRAGRWLAGLRVVDVRPNGVGADYYGRSSGPERPRRVVCWGRLDFGTNVEALEWFGRKVWPRLREEAPDGQFTIIGFDPTDAVKRLAARQGVVLMANMPDIRTAVARHALVVLPFVSGSGIKNKLLEAAALGKPIVCTPRSCRGLRSAVDSGLVSTDEPREWVRQILDLWRDDSRRHRLVGHVPGSGVEHPSLLSAALGALSAPPPGPAALQIPHTPAVAGSTLR